MQSTHGRPSRAPRWLSDRTHVWSARAASALPPHKQPSRGETIPRVVVLDHAAELGGAELALARMLDALPSDDAEVQVILFSHGPLVERLELAGHAVEVLPMQRSLLTTDRHRAASSMWAALRNTVASFPFALRLVRRLRELEPDVIHTTSLKSDLIAVPVARLLGVPLVWHVHDRIAPDYLPVPLVHVIRWLARVAPAAVIANSEATASTLPRAAGLTVVRPGLAPVQVAAAQRPRPGRPVIGMVGRISPTKGQLELVRATALVIERHPDIEVRIVGSPMFGHEEYHRRLEAEIQALGLSDVVHLAGFTSEVTQQLDQFSVAVHAATTPEPYGQIVAEAMARGVPVVATRGGGIPEVMGRGADVGWLVEPGDVEELAGAICQALDDPGEAERRGLAGWARATVDLGIAEGAWAIARTWRNVRTRPRVAIAHDYLTQRGGAERVVLAMSKAFPDAVIHTTLYEPNSTYPQFQNCVIVTSPMNRVRFLRADHRRALPLLPFAAGLMKIDADVVVASSSGWAHGMRRTGAQIVYCHAPARWLYQSETYIGGPLTRSSVGLILLMLRPMLRRWDHRAATRAGHYLANSTVVARRIEAAYGRSATVLHPPFAVDPGGDLERVPGADAWEPGSFALVVSRLLPYKNVGVVVDAFESLGERLLVIGDGPLREELERRAGKNLIVAHGVPDEQMRWAYANAGLLVAASHEDFGLTPLEAAAFGLPTVALRAGGYLDTIVPAVNGEFFDEPTIEGIAEAVARARSRRWDAEAIRAHADAFSEERFVQALQREVGLLLNGKPEN